MPNQDPAWLLLCSKSGQHNFFGRCCNKGLCSLLPLPSHKCSRGWGKRKYNLPSACGQGQDLPRNLQVSRGALMSLQGLQVLWKERGWICAQGERCWVSGDSPRGDIISHKRSNQKTEPQCVCGGRGGAKEEGRESLLSFQLAQSGHSVNICCLGTHNFFQGFPFSPSPWRSSEHICWKVTLIGVLFYIGWASPQENLRQPLWICPLASHSDFHVFFFFPHLLPFFTTGSYKQRYYLFICVILLLDSLQFLDLLPSPLFKINLKCRNMT